MEDEGGKEKQKIKTPGTSGRDVESSTTRVTLRQSPGEMCEEPKIQ